MWFRRDLRLADNPALLSAVSDACGHSVGHHRHRGGHRDPQPADTRLADHLVRLDGEAIEPHLQQRARPVREAIAIT
jgi:hypothetical protein